MYNENLKSDIPKDIDNRIKDTLDEVASIIEDRYDRTFGETKIGRLDNASHDGFICFVDGGWSATVTLNLNDLESGACPPTIRNRVESMQEDAIGEPDEDDRDDETELGFMTMGATAQYYNEGNPNSEFKEGSVLFSVWCNFDEHVRDKYTQNVVELDVPLSQLTENVIADIETYFKDEDLLNIPSKPIPDNLCFEKDIEPEMG